MNDFSDPLNAQAATLLSRGESLRRSELWTTALVHAVLLLIAFLAVVTLYQIATGWWPMLEPDPEATWPLYARLMLIAMAAWIFISTARRGAQQRDIEMDLIRLEMREILQRPAHS